MSYAAATGTQRAEAVRACQRFIDAAKYATADYRQANPRVDAQAINGVYKTIEELLTDLKTKVDAVAAAT